MKEFQELQGALDKATQAGVYTLAEVQLIINSIQTVHRELEEGKVNKEKCEECTCKDTKIKE